MPVMSIDAARAARQIVDACRCGDAEVVVGWPAKLAVVANGRGTVGDRLGMRLANRAAAVAGRARGDARAADGKACRDGHRPG